MREWLTFHFYNAPQQSDYYYLWYYLSMVYIDDTMISPSVFEWSDHPLHGSLLEMGDKKSGFYLYMGTERDHLIFKHIASDAELRVTSRSMEVPAGAEPGRSISFGGFVKWRGEWWFTGAQLGWGYDANLIKKEKESEDAGKRSIPEE